MNRMTEPNEAATIALGLFWELTDVLIAKKVITKSDRVGMLERLAVNFSGEPAKLRKDSAATIAN